MKSKPNTDQFKIKKDPTSFLEGGDIESNDRTSKNKQTSITNQESLQSQIVMESKIHREQKVFRLPLDLINLLKRESYEKSVKTGSRVTETELVEQALRNFFKI